MSQSILTNTTIALSGRAVNVVLGIVATGLLTRVLGPANYGSLSLLISFGLIIQLIADLGLYLTLVRDIAKHPQREAELLTNTVTLRALLLTASFLLASMISLLLPPLQGLTTAFLVIALGLSWQSISQLYLGVYQHHQTVWRATVGDIIGRLLQLAGIVVLAKTAPTIGGMAVAFTIGTGAALAVHYFWLPPSAKDRPRSSPKKWRHLLATSWPLGLVLLLNAVYFRADLLIISLFRPAAEVGWYGVAYRVVESALFIPAMLGGLLLPRFSEQDEKKKQRPAQYLEQGLKLLLLAAGLVVAILLVLNRPIITLLAGPGYAAAAPLLAILSLALATMFVGTTFGYALVALKQQTKLLKLYGVLAIFNVIANLIFIPRYGALAAASTTVVTELLATAIAGYFVWQSLPFRFPTKYCGQVVLASAGAILVTAYVLPQLNLIVQLSAITASYLLLTGLAGLLSGRHFELLRYAQPK